MKPMHSRQRTAPRTCSTSSSRILSGSRTGAAVTLATRATTARLISASASAAAIASAAGCHQRAMEGRRDRKQKGALDAVGLGDLDGALDRRLRAGHHDLSAAIVIGDAGTGAPRGGRCASPAIFRACSVSAPSNAAMAPSPTGTAFCMASPRKRRSRAASAILRAPAAASAEYSPSEWPATNCTSRESTTPFSASSARRAARLTAISAGWALAVSCNCGGIALEHQRRELFAERFVHFLEHRPRRCKSVEKRLAHADRLRPLARKDECDRQRLLPYRLLA